MHGPMVWNLTNTNQKYELSRNGLRPVTEIFPTRSEETGTFIMKAVNEQVYPQVIDQVGPQVRSQVEWQIMPQVRIQVGLQFWHQVGLQVWDQAEEDLL